MSYGALRRIVEFRLRIAGEPVALLEDLVDFVNEPLAESGRAARAQGAPALGTALFFGAGLPEREPHGMALDVLQCIHDGVEAADQVRGIDGAVVDALFHFWSGWWDRSVGRALT